MAQPMVDVCIVGAGAGGSVVAKILGEAGLKVVVLDAGPRFNPATDYPADKQDFEVRGPETFAPSDPRRDLYVWEGKSWFKYLRVKGVGGSTLVYTAVTPRLHASDFHTYTLDGVGTDWPITYHDLEPYYNRVEWDLGVSGSNTNPFDEPRGPYPTPPHGLNCASKAIKRGADKLGWTLVPSPQAVPTIPWKGRPACINCGALTVTGCPIQAKSSADVTYIPWAEATGNVTVKPLSRAREITVGPDGRARSVIYLDAFGEEHEQPAKAIVLAANSVETPRLLLMSRSSLFPNGLANSSGLVGRYFTEHLAVFTFGVMPERVDPWKGSPAGGVIQDFYETRKEHPFARGWAFEVDNGWLWPLATARRIPGWGKAHKDAMRRQFGHMVGIATVGEQLPDPQNRVTLDPKVVDDMGLPVPRIRNVLGENDRAMVEEIKKRSKELLEAAGAIEITNPKFVPGGSSHYMGTCRMGDDPKGSVVDQWGRAHDVPNLFVADGSIFVTGAAVNPTLTIHALAMRVAEHMVALGKRGDL